MSDPKPCAECGAALPAYWPKGLCASCAIDGALLRDTTTEFTRFGDYDLLEEIARGGMGIVYKARQRGLERIVAVKMILAGGLAGKEFVQRFRTEASAAAILQHPHIVAIHDVGVHEGRHYFSMDYVDGQSLAQLVGQQPLPGRKAAGYAENIARAIHYAHEHGILHRDLKPSNVLIDANDQPRITDFGLAKRLDGESSLTMSGQVLGSPNFMPPEQAGAKRGKVSPSSDVYAIGGILYYLLTARAPFQADSWEHTITQVLNAEPVSPRLLNPSVPRDLETITLKCLEKEPSRRYQTAEELADELGRILRDEPIQAHPVNAPEKLWRWCRRKPAFASAVGFAVTALILGFVMTSWQWRRAERIASSEYRQRQQAEAQAYNSDMNLAQQALAQNNVGHALEILNRHRPALGRKDVRGWEWRYLWQSCQSDALLTLCRQSNDVFSVCFARDGRLLAVEDESGDVTIWDLVSRKCVARRQTRIAIQRIAASPVSNELVFSEKGDDDNFFLVWWDTHQYAERLRVRLPGEAREVAFSGDGSILAVWCAGPADPDLALTEVPPGANRHILLLENASGHKRAQLRAERVIDGTGNLLALSHGGEILAHGTPGGQVVVVDVASRREMRIATTTENTMAIAISNDGRTLATAAGYSEPFVKLWDLNSGKPLARLEGHRSYVNSLAFSPDGKLLASGSGDQTIRLWDWKAKQGVAILRGHFSEVFDVAFSPDGQTLASGCKDGTVCLWKVAPQPPESNYETLPSPMRDWTFTPDSTEIIGLDRTGALRSWEAASLREKRKIVELGTNNTSFVLSKNGMLLAVGDLTGQVRVLSLSSPREAKTFHACVGRAMVIGFSANEQFLFTRDTNNLVSVWDTRSWQLNRQWQIDEPFYRLRLAPATDVMATGRNGQLILWDTMYGRRLWTAQAQDELEGIDFSGDGKLIATASGKGPVKLCDAATGRELATLKGFLQGTHSLKFSPDDKRLAIGSDGKEALKLWDPQLRQEVLTLEGQSSIFFKIVFSPDGRTISSANYQGIVHLWRAPSWKEIEGHETRRTAGR
jgi:WD40 repeat protein/predicted Ser/Thr protein kinase